MIDDLRVAWRVTRRSPLAAGLAVMALAIGVGAALAVFMVVQGVVLRDLPYPEPDRLVLVWRGTAEDPSQRGPLSPPDLMDVRERTPAFAALAGLNSFSTTFVPGGGTPEQIQLGAMAGPFFRLIGVRPALGGTLEADEVGPINTRDPEVLSVIVLSHDFWVRQLGADPAVVGRTLHFGGSRMRVIGVMPDDFALHMPVDAGMSTDLAGWTPLGIDPATASREGAYLKVWGRLARGATIGEAQAQLDGTAAQLREAHRTHDESGFRLRAVPLQRDVIAHASGVLLLLAVAGVITLLVACANVAGLLLVQFMGRTQELAVRAALGANRLRIVRQLTTEAALLTVAGAGLGLAIAPAAVTLLLGLDPGLIPTSWAIEMNLAVVGVAAATAACATLLSGTIPAVMISRASLGHGVRSRSTATPTSTRVRRVAVACQVAGALLLVYGSATLAQTVSRWQQADFGFRANGVQTFAMVLPFASYRGPETWVRFWDDLEQRLAAVPGVEAAASGSDLPMAGDLSLEPYLPSELSGATTWGARTALHRSVSPGYFDATGIRLLEGRTHTPGDREGAPQVVVVDAEIARQLRRDRDGPVIGRRLDVTRHTFRGGYNVERTTADVVGVVAAVPHDHPDAAPAGMIYLSHAQYPLRGMYLLLRGEGGRVPDMALTRAALRELDPALPVFRVRALRDIVSGKLAPTRFILALVAALAAAVTVLVSVALFGMVAETVRQGRRDMGIRLALGATAAQLTRTVLSGTAALLGLGVLAGAILTPGIGRLIATTIQSRETWSGSALAAAIVAVLAVGLLSCYLPARRAGRIDPLQSLRQD